jgi:transcriptional regulator with XRE-family HTH domain
MTKGKADGQIDQLVKAGWLAVGLSQTEIAEVLDAAFRQKPQDRDGSSVVDIGRLMEVAKALGIPADFLHGSSALSRRKKTGTRQGHESPQTLLELRLLRAFFELSDQRARRMLVYLAEQIVKRQTARPGDTG